MGERKCAIKIGPIGVDYLKADRTVKYRFLSCAHPDCYIGLTEKPMRTVYCSEETASILGVLIKEGSQKLFVDEKHIKPLRLYKPHQFGKFSVTLLDANHLPGAVMFIFEGPAIPDGPVLCTGRFRADVSYYTSFRSISTLWDWKFGKIYLGNAYMEATIAEFPSVEDSLNKLVTLIKSVPDQNQVFIVIEPLVNFRFLQKLSEKLEQRICLYPLSKRIADILYPDNNFDISNESAHLQAIDRSSASDLLKSQADSENITVIELNVFAHEISRCKLLIDDRRVKVCDYSDQCSLNEIRDFLSQLRFNRIEGIEKQLTIAQRNDMCALSLPDTVWDAGALVDIPEGMEDSSFIEQVLAADEDGVEKYLGFEDFCRSGLQKLLNTQTFPAEDESARAESTENLVKELEGRLSGKNIANKVTELLLNEAEDFEEAREREEQRELAEALSKQQSFNDILSKLPLDVLERYKDACKNSPSFEKEESAEHLVEIITNRPDGKIGELLKKAYLEVSGTKAGTSTETPEVG